MSDEGHLIHLNHEDAGKVDLDLITALNWSPAVRTGQVVSAIAELLKHPMGFGAIKSIGNVPVPEEQWKNDVRLRTVETANGPVVRAGGFSTRDF